ncbi:uncharacterized protein [Dysidea avara]|uniref:uncharacterized protein n=1 Tax=Dysidea avara TaxID=196820 RepID=UPI003317CA86
MAERLCDIVCREFDNEVECRLSEAHLIQERIKESRELLHRLRYAILASYYNDPSQLEKIECTVDGIEDEVQQPLTRLLAERQWESNVLQRNGEASEFVEELKDLTTSILSDVQFVVSPPDSPTGSSLFNMDSQEHSVNPSVMSSLNPSPMVSAAATPMLGSPRVKNDERDDKTTDVSVSRFYITKRIIVGNTSQYLLTTAKNDATTHKWMVYVRGPPEDDEISQFISSVWFFLHPSYAPNDLVKVTKPPFHLVRRGWGEFPIRVQLHFDDPQQRPIDIIHNLKLDKTKTGQQTLGAETIVDIELEKASSVKDNTNTEPNKHVASNSSDTLLNHTLENYMKRISDLEKSEMRNKMVESPQVSTPVDDNSHASDGTRSQVDDQPTEDDDDDDSDSDTVTKPTRTGAVYHIDIPTADPDEVVMLDHCYDHCVVVSYKRNQSKSLCTADNKPALDDAVEQCMHKVVRLVPLIGERCPSTPFTAPSVEEFYKWQIGKQRAAEWMRAKSLQDLVIDQLPSDESHVIPSTRTVVYWCRRNGYTPLDATSSNHCIVCGCVMDIDEDNSDLPYHQLCGIKWYIDGGYINNGLLYTMTKPFGIYEQLASMEQELLVKEEDQRVDDMDIDIATVTHTNPIKRSCKEKNMMHNFVRPAIDPRIPSNCKPSSAALRWVNQEASEVNVVLQPILMDGVLAHAPTHMLYAATQKFLTELIQQSLVEECDEDGTSHKERCITPAQVYSAISKIPTFDFLTNQYLGLSSEDFNS